MKKIILGVFLLIGLVVPALSMTAVAQPSERRIERVNPEIVRELPRQAQLAPDGDQAQVQNPAQLEGSRLGAVLFWLVAASLVAGGIIVITRSNLVSAVMWMVGTFFMTAVLYTMLYAHFLAVIQVLVYAGAIMVLFVFVIMILNRPEAEPYGVTGMAGKVIAGVAILYLLVRLATVLWGVAPKDPKLNLAPGPVVGQEIVRDPDTGAPLRDERTKKVIKKPDWGSTRAVGENLFSHYLFPFEAVSVILLIAVVGAIAVAHPTHKPESTALPDDAPRDTEA